MLKRCKAPPENMLNMPSSVPFWVEKNAANRAASIPAPGMSVPIRYTTKASSRNHKRLRISAKRVMSPRAAVGLVLEVATFLDLEAPAGRFDRALGALGRRDHLILDDVGLGDRTGQNDLHDLGAFRDQVGLDQAGQGHIRARNAHQIGERQLGTRGLHGGTEPDLGQTPLQGHLTAFYAHLVIAPLARALPLHPPTTALALPPA